MAKSKVGLLHPHIPKSPNPHIPINTLTINPLSLTITNGGFAAVPAPGMVAGAGGAPAARSARDKLAQPRTARRRAAPGRPKNKKNAAPTEWDGIEQEGYIRQILLAYNFL
jgi:hypothetical protein